MAKRNYELKGHVPVYGPKAETDFGSIIGVALFLVVVLLCVSQCTG